MSIDAEICEEKSYFLHPMICSAIQVLGTIKEIDKYKDGYTF